jgi:hypothetical protein
MKKHAPTRVLQELDHFFVAERTRIRGEEEEEEEEEERGIDALDSRGVRGQENAAL